MTYVPTSTPSRCAHATRLCETVPRHLADAGTMFARTQVVAVEAVAKFESGAAAKFEAKKAAGLAGVGAVPLTAANFDAEIAGKGAFIKFLAPW
jgi:hypothetical protein